MPADPPPTLTRPSSTRTLRPRKPVPSKSKSSSSSASQSSSIKSTKAAPKAKQPAAVILQHESPSSERSNAGEEVEARGESLEADAEEGQSDGDPPDAAAILERRKERERERRANLKEKADKERERRERKRRSMACQRCQKGKLKCDRLPVCTSCTIRSLSCSYPHAPPLSPRSQTLQQAEHEQAMTAQAEVDRLRIVVGLLMEKERSTMAGGAAGASTGQRTRYGQPIASIHQGHSSSRPAATIPHQPTSYAPRQYQLPKPQLHHPSFHGYGPPPPHPYYRPPLLPATEQRETEQRRRERDPSILLGPVPGGREREERERSR